MRNILQIFIMLLVVNLAAAQTTDHQMFIEAVKDTFVIRYEERPARYPVDSLTVLNATVQVPVERIPVNMWRWFWWEKGQKVYFGDPIIRRKPIQKDKE